MELKTPVLPELEKAADKLVERLGKLGVPKEEAGIIIAETLHLGFQLAQQLLQVLKTGLEKEIKTSKKKVKKGA